MSDHDSRKISEETGARLSSGQRSSGQPSSNTPWSPTSLSTNSNERSLQPELARPPSILPSQPAGPSPALHLPRSPSLQSSAAKAPKVAIPRLTQKGDTGSVKLGGRHRVVHACEPCRSRKTKCSGEKPVCKHCQDFNVVCVYADGKRDRAKRLLDSMATD
jgi:hypothetical protein